MSNLLAIDQDRTGRYIAHYERAVAALQEAKDCLSLEGLTVVDISIEALKARGKIAGDDRAKQAARDLEVEKSRTAVKIAEAIVSRDKPFKLAGRFRHIKAPLGANGVLRSAGWSREAANIAIRIGYANDEELKKLKESRRALRTAVELHIETRPPTRILRTKIRSAAYNNLFSCSTGQGIRLSYISAPMQRIAAKQLAEEFEDRDEVVLARRSVTQVRDWCDKFLKALPKVRASR